MKITFEGESKEIAAFALAVQKRLDEGSHPEDEAAKAIAESVIAAWRSPTRDTSLEQSV